LIKSDIQSEKKTENAHTGVQSTNESSELQVKILLIDSERDRQGRIAILKDRGFRVYPALSMEQAESRCRPGAYDLIIVNASHNRDAAIAFCDGILTKDPKQQVLTIIGEGAGTSSDDRTVSSDPEKLAARVESLFPSSGSRSRRFVA
jgi:PleD family two-component response regulator